MSTPNSASIWALISGSVGEKGVGTLPASLGGQPLDQIKFVRNEIEDLTSGGHP